MTVAIVGAGLAGLFAGRALERAGVPAVIFEAGALPGGRLASRHTAAGWADSGAQFFTVREPRFQAFVDEWLRDGLVFRWCTGFPAGMSPADDGFPRYAARGGMRRLAEHVARPLDVRLGQRVAGIVADDLGWLVRTDDGETFMATGVLLTPPVPAALPLVAARLPDETRRRLTAVRYRRTLSAVVAVEESTLPPPGAVQRPNDRLAFVADNQQKGLASAPLLTIHASPDWSDALWPLDDEAAVAHLVAAARPYFRGSAGAAVLDRWPFALPEEVLADRFVAVGSLLFAGDAFAGPRVEGAALSGLAAGEQLAAIVPPAAG
jgi:renalase